jgi:uncharacterized surface protein with fasciclin (FAS1) repeats
MPAAGLAALVAAAPSPAAAALTSPSVMQLGQAVPDVQTVLSLIGNSGMDLATYLANPSTVCTFFAPTNQAMANSVNSLGPYVGLAAQNATLTAATYNYHVIPGVALTAAQLTQLNQSNTRANETLWIWTKE